MRYLWDHYHQYRNGANPIARAAMPMLYHKLREWDVSSSARVDNFVANSNFIRQRIMKKGNQFAVHTWTTEEAENDDGSKEKYQNGPSSQRRTAP